MRFVISILLLNLCNYAGATIYYISPSGLLTNSGTQAAPWSYAKLQTEAAKTSGSLINAGDSVFLQRGGTYYGGIRWVRSGTSSQPIYIGAYGTGAKPVISGFTQITAWTSAGTNLWESSVNVSPLDTCNLVLLNGKQVGMGRYPNETKDVNLNYGWIRATQTGTIETIYSSNLPAPTVQDWTGAWVNHKTQRWVVDRNQVISHTWDGTKSTLKVSGRFGYTSEPGWGFFFNNHPATLDLPGEWYYNHSTGKLLLYATKNPATTPMDVVKLATVDTLLHIYSSSYLTVQNLRFEGANTDAIQLTANNRSPVTTITNVAILNCEIPNYGVRGIDGAEQGRLSNSTVQNCTITDGNNYAIDASNTGANVHIVGNTVRRVAMVWGMNNPLPGNGLGGIIGNSTQPGHRYGKNIIDSVGYNAIRFGSPNATIDSNRLTNYNIVTDDGGGIYTWGTPDKGGSRIEYNYVEGSSKYNSWAGSNKPTLKQDGSLEGDTVALMKGIYPDDFVGGINTPFYIRNNFVINNSRSGVYMHNVYNITLENNVIVNNGITQLLIEHDHTYNDPSKPYILQDDSLNLLVIKNNIFMSSGSKQMMATIKTYWDDSVRITKLDEPLNRPMTENLFNGIDSNYYMRPASGDTELVEVEWNWRENQTPYKVKPRSQSWRFLKLSEWTSRYRHDAASKNTPVRFAMGTPIDSFALLLTNPTYEDSTVTLTRSYMRHDGQIYRPGQVTIAPFQSLVLLRYDIVDPVLPPVGSSGYVVLKRRSTGGPALTKNGKVLIKLKPLIKQNYWLWSEELEDGMINKTGVTVTANITLVPDNTTTGDRATITANNTSTKHLTQTVTLPVVSGNLYTFSAYVKDVDRRYVQMFAGATAFGSQAFADFDLTTGTVTLTGSSVVEANIENATNGWKRVWMTVRATSTQSSTLGTIALANGPTMPRATQYTVTTPLSLDVWGVQFNPGYKQTYIKATATAIQ